MTRHTLRWKTGRGTEQEVSIQTKILCGGDIDIYIYAALKHNILQHISFSLRNYATLEMYDSVVICSRTQVIKQ